jgi:hypothetical protein
MLPCGIVLVLSRFQVMTESNPGMMRGLHMIPRFVVLGGLAMMFGSLFIVLCCLFVMLVDLVLFHSILPDVSWLKQRSAAKAFNDFMSRPCRILIDEDARRGADDTHIGVWRTDSRNMRAKRKIGS